MTALCGGGTSTTAPGVGQQLVFSAALITEGLGLISPWLLPVAGLIDSFVYQATTQCAGDPPAMPSASQLNPVNAIGGVLNPNSAAWLTAVNNLLLNWAWQQYCVCTTNPQPTFTFPPPPSGVSLPTTTSGRPCLQASYVGDVFNYNGNPGLNDDLQILEWPGSEVQHTIGGTPNRNLRQLQTPLPQAFTLTGTLTNSDNASHFVDVFLGFYDSGFNLIQNNAQTATVPAGGTTQISISNSLPAAAVYSQCTASGIPFVAGKFGCSLNIQWLCGGTSSTTPCAPGCSDPQILEMLNTLLQLTTSLFESTNPNVKNYSEGTVHSGLTGAGTVTIAASTIAIRVNITTDLPGGRIDLGSPNYLFDRGYIVQLALEAPLRGITRLVYNPQLFQLSPVCEQIGYTIPAGEVISITELSRAPG